MSSEIFFRAENILFTGTMLLYFAAMVLYFVFVAVKKEKLADTAYLLLLVSSNERREIPQKREPVEICFPVLISHLLNS